VVRRVVLPDGLAVDLPRHFRAGLPLDVRLETRHGSVYVTPTVARQLALALIDAADAADGLQ
jgi:hypothetical protein